jgi:MFS transporter, OFA family, oxalate/formate antiporter
MDQAPSVPPKAWVATFAGTAVNLCLGILYGWSVWKANLVGNKEHPSGSPMTGLDAGWTYLTDAQATSAYVICGMMFALMMIPGGRIQDRFGPRSGATLGGLFLAGGCVLAGLMKSYVGLLLGFGILGGIGMGFGYAAATPAAVKWFGPHRRGLVVGLVVGGYGGAAIYISPLAKSLIAGYGLSGSFIGLGVLFAMVVIVAARFLVLPPDGYTPPAGRAGASGASGLTAVNWPAAEMLRTWQFYWLVFMFIGSAQSGLLVIANAAPMLNATSGTLPFFAAHAWILASFGGLMNATGRVSTGFYSDRIGRNTAYIVNGTIAAVCLFLMPTIMASGNVLLLFVAVGAAIWQFGGGLALMPAFTADFFGPKYLGFNYGLVFIGWGIAFLVPQLAGYLKDATGSLSVPFYLSGTMLLCTVILSRFLTRPMAQGESQVNDEDSQLGAVLIRR